MATRSKWSRRAEETLDGLGHLRLGLGDLGAARHEHAGHADDEGDRSHHEGERLGQVDAQGLVQGVSPGTCQSDRRVTEANRVRLNS